MSGKHGVGAKQWKGPDDAPELTDAFFEQATVYNGEQVIRRGRPRAAHAKAQVTLRLDAEVLAALRATGPGWQTRANDALKHWLAAKPRRAG